jgi:hypothetical protein
VSVAQRQVRRPHPVDARIMHAQVTIREMLEQLEDVGAHTIDALMIGA